jgi:D-amino-acid dehydrogenase
MHERNLSKPDGSRIVARTNASRSDEKRFMHICVLGAGVVGLTTAYYLARAGHQVTVVERNGEPGQGASYANGGQLSYSYVAPLAAPGALAGLFGGLLSSDRPLRLTPRIDPRQWHWAAGFLKACTAPRMRRSTAELQPLAYLSRAGLRALVAEEEIDFDYHQRGKLVIHGDARALDAAKALAEFQARLGAEQSMLDAEACLALEPSLRAIRRRIRGGVYTPSDDAGDCQKFCAGLDRLLAARYGVERRYHHEIGKLRREGRRIRSALSDKGEIEAEQFVLAAGLASRRLARSLGFDLPLYPLKGYSLTIPVTGDEASPRLSVTDSARRVVYARLGGSLRAAAMVDVGARHGAVEPRRIAALKRQVAESFPGLSGLDRAQAWAGQRPATAQGKPILGPSPFENLWLNLGHGALGFTLACGTAQLVADLVQGARPRLAIEPFRLGSVH